ncbi:MAG: serine hydrolase domain-containing protein [Flavobacteriales bacterium]
MKIVLYVILAIITAVVGLFVWAYFFYKPISKLEIPEGATNQERVELIDHWFSEIHADGKFNGGVLITKNGKPLLAKTYGFENAEKNKALSNHSLFRLASVSKQFTAGGIMVLKEQNNLDYDDLVSKHIPDFPYKKVTIRHLLNQTSGVPDVYLDLAEKNKEEIGVLTNKKALNLLIKSHPKPDFKPNDKFVYSNTNYIILACIIEQISGESFDDFMKTNLFIPLGMNETRVWNLISEDKTFEGKTEGFYTRGKKTNIVTPSFIDGVAGDGGVFSSINDFVIWDQFWYGNAIISEEHMKEAFKKPVLNDGSVSDYGFGWIIVNDDVMMHNGKWLAASTSIMRNIKKKTCIVVLDNSSNLYFDEIMKNF